MVVGRYRSRVAMLPVGEHLEDVVVAHPARRVAGARSPPGPARRSARRPPPGRSRTPGRPAGCARRRRPRSRPSRGPPAPRRIRPPPRPPRRPAPRTAAPSSSRGGRSAAGPTGSPYALHGREGAGQLLREARLLQHQVAPQADDLVHVLDEHRARLHACAAGHAVPDRVLRDGGVRRWAGRRPGRERSSRPCRAPDRDGMSGTPGSASTAIVADAHDHRLGVERLARGPGRTGILAAAALGAGEAVEQVLPGQVLDGLDAEARGLRLEVHRRQLRPAAPACGTRVEERGRDVEVLGTAGRPGRR